MNTLTSLLCITTSILWRLGGSDGYSKNWRRIGCTHILSFLSLFLGFIPLYKFVAVLLMIAWGCWSYFGWINYIIRIFWKDIEIDREYWWNFFASGLLIQESILVYAFSIENAATGLLWAFTGALMKVFLDKQDWLDRIMPNLKATVSELWFGAWMFLGLVFN